MAFTDAIKFVQVIIDNANVLTAKQEDVLEGSVFVGIAKKIQSGTIPKLQMQSNVSLKTDESFTVKYGYNPKEYVVSAVSLSDQTVATATEDDILINSTAWVNGELIHGAMPNIGALDITLYCDDSILIDKGYHNGNGRITAASLASQTQGNVKAKDMIVGSIAWSNGVEIVGTMPENPSKEITLKSGESYIIPEGYHIGNGKVIAASLLSQTQATATENDIAMDETAWVNGELITGKLPKFSKDTFIIPINGSYVIPYGIHPGTEVVTQNIETQDSMTLTPAFEDQTIEVKDKYMTGNIILTGINALNFNNFDSDKEILFNNMISGINISGNIRQEVYRVSVDNWHDQATDNIYYVDCSITGGSNTINTNGIIFSNNLNFNAIDTSKLYLIPIFSNSSEYLALQVTLDSDTNAHVFELVGSLTSDTVSKIFDSATSIDITISVKEVMQLRRYGDEHDTNN